MAASGHITWSGADLGRNIKIAQAQFFAAAFAIVQRGAGQGQSWMRANAPWTDRTGNARQGLFAKAGQDGDKFTIVMYHTMPYGIYLEQGMEGRFKIIEPALQRTGTEVMSTFQGLLDRIRV